MADHHLGYSMPVGGVVAYEDAISLSGVGFDIAPNIEIVHRLRPLGVVMAVQGPTAEERIRSRIPRPA